MLMLFIGLVAGCIIGVIAMSLCRAASNRDSGQECLDCQQQYNEQITNLKDDLRACEELCKANRHAYLTVDGKLRAAQKCICMLRFQLDTKTNGYALEVTA